MFVLLSKVPRMSLIVIVLVFAKDIVALFSLLLSSVIVSSLVNVPDGVVEKLIVSTLFVEANQSSSAR